MFGRKKNQALFNAIDDSRTVVYDFRLRAKQQTILVRSEVCRHYDTIKATLQLNH